MKAATARCTASTPTLVPIDGNVSSDTAIPAGHELTKIAIAVAISLPANQSVSIFVSCTLRITPPIPATSRAAICRFHESANAMVKLPTSISANAPSTVPLVAEFLADRAARQRKRNSRRKVEPDQHADIGDADAELAAEQRRDRRHALELERHGGANQKQKGQDTPAIPQCVSPPGRHQQRQYNRWCQLVRVADRHHLHRRFGQHRPLILRQFARLESFQIGRSGHLARLPNTVPLS